MAFSTLKELKVHFASSDEIYDINQQILIAEFSDMLVSLRNFVTLNDVAFQKIIKKYKKIYDDELIQAVENHFLSQYFLTSKALDTIMSPIHVWKKKKKIFFNTVSRVYFFMEILKKLLKQK